MSVGGSQLSIYPSFLQTSHRNHHTLETDIVVDLEILQPDSASSKGLILSWGSTIRRQPLSDSCRELLCLGPHPAGVACIWCLTTEAWQDTDEQY